MLLAFPASTLLSRAYYAGGATSYWILSWAAVTGWPLTALLLPFLYPFSPSPRPTPLTFKFALWCSILGLLTALDNLLFAWAYAHLPASTAALLASSSLAFSTFFGWAIANNRLNLPAINAIVSITVAVTIVALDSQSDGSPGVSKSKYAVAFILDIVGSALHGLIFALSEVVLGEMGQRLRSFHMAVEFQTMVTFTAFLATSVGVLARGDFQQMRQEASTFKHGQRAYAMVLLWAAVSFQVGIQAGTVVVYVASTVLAGIHNAVTVPLTSVAAVVIFKDSMSGFKILSLLTTTWGFVSYTLGKLNLDHRL
ncbi:purine permease 5 isoform X2 [Wolffia australiana]